jgi:hypothetical protein
VVLWLCNPHYIRDVVVPTVRAVSYDPSAALDQLRSELVTYFSLPSGFDPDEGATDEFIRLLAAVGTRDEAAAAVCHYRDCGTTSPCIGGISGTDFDGTLDALA